MMKINSTKLTCRISLLGLISLAFTAQVSWAGMQKQSSVELPIKFLSVDNPMPIVTISDGKQSTEFFLDTGSTDNLTLIPADIKRFNAKPTGAKHRSVTNYGRYRAKEYVISNWNLGGFKLKNVVCEELPEIRKQNEPFASRSTIGLGLLRNYAVLIDYAHRKLVLYSGDSYRKQVNSTFWIKTPSPYDPVGVILSGKIGDEMYRFCIDSGCVAYDRAGKRSYNIMKGIHKKSFNLPMTAIDSMPVANSVNLQIGQETITDLNFMFPDFVTQPETVHGFLGGDFLEKYAVLVDIKHQCLYIRKNSQKF